MILRGYELYMLSYMLAFELKHLTFS